MTHQLRSHSLPLLLQLASKPETVSHGLKVVVAVIRHINPGQTPVVETDLGALHIEMLWHASGVFHDGSGVTTAFVNSGIANAGTAQSFLICSNITRTRHYKQKWVLALELLKRRTYDNYLAKFNGCELTATYEGAPLNMDVWLKDAMDYGAGPHKLC